MKTRSTGRKVEVEAFICVPVLSGMPIRPPKSRAGMAEAGRGWNGAEVGTDMDGGVTWTGIGGANTYYIQFPFPGPIHLHGSTQICANDIDGTGSN